jgi:hypothetical protein
MLGAACGLSVNVREPEVIADVKFVAVLAMVLSLADIPLKVKVCPLNVTLLNAAWKILTGDVVENGKVQAPVWPPTLFVPPP